MYNNCTCYKKINVNILTSKIYLSRFVMTVENVLVSSPLYSFINFNVPVEYNLVHVKK